MDPLNEDLNYFIEYEDGYIKYVSYLSYKRIEEEDKRLLCLIGDNFKKVSKVFFLSFLYLSTLTIHSSSVEAKNKEPASMTVVPFQKDWGFGRSYDYRPISERIQKSRPKKKRARYFWHSDVDIHWWMLYHSYSPFRGLIEKYERECHDGEKFIFYRMRDYTFKRGTYLKAETRIERVKEPLSLAIREAIYPDLTKCIEKEVKITYFTRESLFPVEEVKKGKKEGLKRKAIIEICIQKEDSNKNKKEDKNGE